jgi:type I restriction enzyme S subunit
MRLRVGSGLPNIQMKEINKFLVKLPEIAEQQKLANFFSSLDSKIDLVSTQIKNTKAFKKGLSQQMFV